MIQRLPSLSVPLFLRTTLLALVAFSALVAGDSTTTTPFQGITHIVRTETLPRRATMHIVKIDLNAPGLRFHLTPPGGARETVRQTTLEFLAETRAQIAVNAHFFVPYPSTDTESFLVGFAASDGNAYSGFEAPEQSYALVANAPALNIDRDNHASLFDPSTVKGVQVWNAVSGSTQIVTDGRPTIPVYKDETHPEGQLTGGGRAEYSNAKSWYEIPNARTVIGLSADNKTLFLFTVDRAKGSEGLRLSEVAKFLIEEYGVANALNLDGGGSTTLVIADPVTGEASIANASSDNAKGRSVASNLAIFAAPLN